MKFVNINILNCICLLIIKGLKHVKQSNATLPNKLVSPKLLKLNTTIKAEPMSHHHTKFEIDEKQPSINPENIIKTLHNGHSLVMLKRTRVKGFCVECIKKSGDPEYKKSMTKIITYCPQCPGGNWICATCFDAVHQVEEYLLP